MRPSTSSRASVKEASGSTSTSANSSKAGPGYRRVARTFTLATLPSERTGQHEHHENRPCDPPGLRSGQGTRVLYRHPRFRGGGRHALRRRQPLARGRAARRGGPDRAPAAARRRAGREGPVLRLLQHDRPGRRPRGAEGARGRRRRADGRGGRGPADVLLPRPGREQPAGGLRLARRAQGGSDLVDGGLLGWTDGLAAFVVRLGDPPGEPEHELPVGRGILRRRLAPERRRCLAETLEGRVVQLLLRAIASPLELRLDRDDLVEQLALALLLPGFGVGLCEGKRLAKAASVLGGEDEQPGQRRRLQQRPPLLVGERALSGHTLLLPAPI